MYCPCTITSADKPAESTTTLAAIDLFSAAVVAVFPQHQLLWVEQLCSEDEGMWEEGIIYTKVNARHTHTHTAYRPPPLSGHPIP